MSDDQRDDAVAAGRPPSRRAGWAESRAARALAKSQARRDAERADSENPSESAALAAALEEEAARARRWAEAEAATLKAQDEQRERARKALAKRGGVAPEPVDDPVEPVPTSKVEERRAKEPGSGHGLASLRSKVASVIWLAAVLGALILAVGALCVALKLNQDNGLVSAVLDVAHRIDLNELKRFEGSEVVDSSAAVRSALVNFGIAALVWLGVGKILDKLIRP